MNKMWSLLKDKLVTGVKVILERVEYLNMLIFWLGLKQLDDWVEKIIRKINKTL